MKRFESYGWHAKFIGEVANDTVASESALREAMAEEDRPSLIVLRSHIGWPSPHKTDTAAAHGDPLGVDEVRATKEILGMPPDEDLLRARRGDRVLPDAPSNGVTICNRSWQERFDAWDGDKSAWDACMNGRGLDGWDAKLPSLESRRGTRDEKGHQQMPERNRRRRSLD